MEVAELGIEIWSDLTTLKEGGRALFNSKLSYVSSYCISSITEDLKLCSPAICILNIEVLK